MNEVLFKQGLKSEWQALKNAGTLDQNTLYFCVDSHEIYKGNLLFGTCKMENMTQSSNTIVEFYGGSATKVVEEDNNG